MLQHNKLLNAAKEYGIAVKDVSDIMQRDAAILSYNSQSELVIDGVPMSWLKVSSQFYCDNKQLTKLAYEALNIQYPKSVIFTKPDDASLKTFFQEGKIYICKPLDSTNGIGVELDIKSLEEVKQYYEKYKYLNTRFLLETYISGKDLRIQVIGGEIVAACIREPAFVIGNGVDSLKTLIEKRRAEMRTQNPSNFLEVDDATLDLLQQQEITLDDIPKLDDKIQLKKVSNMAQGGIATDVTDEIHPMYHKWVSDLVGYLNTGYFGLDLMTKDYAANPIENTNVLEINARADWLHHTFSEHRTHDIAGMILKELFG